jgi:hypothetical protein
MRCVKLPTHCARAIYPVQSIDIALTLTPQTRKPERGSPAFALTQAPLFGRLEYAETWPPPQVQYAFRFVAL